MPAGMLYSKLPILAVLTRFELLRFPLWRTVPTISSLYCYPLFYFHPFSISTYIIRGPSIHFYASYTITLIYIRPPLCCRPVASFLSLPSLICRIWSYSACRRAFVPYPSLDLSLLFSLLPESSIFAAPHLFCCSHLFWSSSLLPTHLLSSFYSTAHLPCLVLLCSPPCVCLHLLLSFQLNFILPPPT